VVIGFGKDHTVSHLLIQKSHVEAITEYGTGT
jgi:hypothetical protein